MLLRRLPAPILAVLLAAAGLAGCADIAEATHLAPGGVDPHSPVAPQVTAAAARDYKYPKFRDIPPRPTDVRAAPAWKAAVVDMVGERRGLKGWAAANPAVIGDTAGFAAVNRAELPPEVAQPGPVGESTEAFAARMRAEAAPPPPPK